MAAAPDARSFSERFPVDAALDAVLVRKMAQRGGPAYVCMGLGEVRERLTRFLASALPGEALAIAELGRLTGGASKEQFVFSLSREGAPAKRYVLRVDPPESMADSSRRQEFDLLRCVAACVPAPPAVWLDDGDGAFGKPMLVTEFVRGVTKPSQAPAGNVTGFGTSFDAGWRERLKRPFVKAIADFHGFDWRADPPPSLGIVAEGGSAAVERLLNWSERLWQEDRLETIPIIDAAFAWLRANMPAVERLSIVHGDYRPGNFLFDEETGAITAILDWELGRLGDPYEDLGYTLQNTGMSVFDESGKLLIGGLVSREEFLELYAGYTGRPIDRARLRYYEILQCCKCAAVIATGVRAATGGKMHINMIGTWLATIGYSFIGDLHRLLAAEI